MQNKTIIVVFIAVILTLITFFSFMLVVDEDSCKIKPPRHGSREEAGKGPHIPNQGFEQETGYFLNVSFKY